MVSKRRVLRSGCFRDAKTVRQNRLDLQLQQDQRRQPHETELEFGQYHLRRSRGMYLLGLGLIFIGKRVGALRTYFG
jgi:hypothetical protein